MNDISRSKLWNASPIAERLYSGREGGVIVRENGKAKPLAVQTADPDDQRKFSWGSESQSGKQLAIALLKDALEDDKRASELADVFNSRVISILPERWTMTRQRILSYTDVMAREKISDLLLESISPVNSRHLQPQ